MSKNFFRPKFNNSRTYIVDGSETDRDTFQEARLRGSKDAYSFHSKAEALRYLELRELAAQGKIEALRLQPRYDLYVDQLKVCRYIADFEYIETGKANRIVTEDVKGRKTPEYKLKSRLFMILYTGPNRQRMFRETKKRRKAGFDVVDFPYPE